MKPTLNEIEDPERNFEMCSLENDVENALATPMHNKRKLSKWQLNMNFQVWNRNKPRMKCSKTTFCFLFLWILIIVILIMILTEIHFLKNMYFVISEKDTFSSVSNQSVGRENNTEHEKTASALNVATLNPIVDLERVYENLPCNTTICKMQLRRVRDVTTVASNETSLWKEPRARRLQRDTGRGKKRRKNKRRPNRSRRRLAPLVATFIGAEPNQDFFNSALIGPWIRSVHDNNQYALSKFHLVENNMAIEIAANGLYSISVQIFYYGESANHSYWILLNSEGLSKSRKLAKCAATTSEIISEVSCYTSIIMHMQKGDRLYIEQEDKNRLINMREGYSHIQLMLLANDTQRKRS